MRKAMIVASEFIMKSPFDVSARLGEVKFERKLNRTYV